MSNVMQSSEILPEVRALVKDALTKSPRFSALPETERKSLAQDTVTALAYILGGADGASQPGAVTLADRPALPTTNPAQHVQEDFRKATAKDTGETGGQRFQKSGAVAAQQGADALTGAISKVNFPTFVKGLIDGVFGAINSSTMSQLNAYAELVKNVAKSVEEFMKDNVSDNSARDNLLKKFPGQLSADLSGDRPKLVPKDDADEQSLPAMFKDLGLPADTTLDEDTIEEKLVPAERRRMALDRQQMLATMVMMGVNRLVVTNGSIEASCLFELKTLDLLKTADSKRGQLGGQQGAGNYDNRSTTTDTSSGGGIWGAIFGGDDNSSHDEWYRGHWDSDTAQFSVTTSSSESSQDKVDLHVKLAGKVNVNFKSDYFPMERMTDVLAQNAIKEKAMGEQAVQIAQINAQARAAKNAPIGAVPPAPPVPAPATSR